MEIITLDFETYWSKDFTLTKMPIELYVRDPKFFAFGVGVKINDEPTEWVIENIGEYLKSLELEKHVVVAHHAQFDAFILSHVYNIYPKRIFDTLSMARAVFGDEGNSLSKVASRLGVGVKGNEVFNTKGKETLSKGELFYLGEYCKNDVELTRKIFNILLPTFPQHELQLIDLIMRMYTRPILALDTKILEEAVRTMRETKEDMLRKAGVTVDEVMSNPKFAQALRNLNVDPPTKISPTTGKETWAFSKTDQAFTDLLDHPDFAVQTLVAARFQNKSTIEETRAERLIEVGKTGSWPVYLKYGATQTHRLAGGNLLNAQNLSRKSVLRNAVIAPPRCALVACDSSNIELRCNMVLAGQSDVVDQLRAGNDLYCALASEWFEREITKQDEMERMFGKVMHLALGYGMGPKKFMESSRLLSGGKITLDEDTASAAVRFYRAAFPFVPGAWQECDRALDYMTREVEIDILTGGQVRTAKNRLHLKYGLPMFYPGLAINAKGEYLIRGDKEYDSKRAAMEKPNKSLDPIKTYGAKVYENICQYIARNIVMEQALELDKWLQKYQIGQIVMLVHDEIVICVREEYANECKYKAVEVMSQSPDWWPEIPLAAEAKIGKTYGECK